jgi:hypothetical protein
LVTPGVRLYADIKTLKAWSQRARRIFYIQLREDVTSQRITMSDSEMVFAAALSSQLHFGSWDSGSRGLSEYINQIDSSKLRLPSVASKVEQIHKTCSGTCDTSCCAHTRTLPRLPTPIA